MEMEPKLKINSAAPLFEAEAYHQEEIKKHGPQACHRQTFRPVKLALQELR